MKTLPAQLNSLSSRRPYARMGQVTSATSATTGGSTVVYLSVRIQGGAVINNVVAGAADSTTSTLPVGTPVLVLRVGTYSVALPLAYTT